MFVKAKPAPAARAQAVAMVVVAVAVRVNVPTVAVETVVAMAAAVTAVALHATTIAMVSFNLHARKARVLHKVAVVVPAVPAGPNQQALPMSHALIADQRASLIPCAPAWI